MDSIIKDETEPEGDNMSLQRTLTSTCQGSKQGDHHERPMETNDDLLGGTQQVNLQMLASGDRASPGNQEMSGQGSLDLTPSETDIGRQPEEAVSVLIETVTQDRHADVDKRHLSKEEKVRDVMKELGCPEMSSDEWETASEDSAAFEENADIGDSKVGNADGKRQRDGKAHSPSQGETAGPMHKEISGENIGIEETFSEEIRPCDNNAFGEETHGNEAISKVSEPRGEDTVAEEAGPHCEDTVHEEAGPPGKETVSVEAGPHGCETASESSGPHGIKTTSEEPGPQGKETTSEEPGSHCKKTVSEEPGPHDNETVSEEPGLHGKEAVSEKPGPHGKETVSEGPGPHGKETTSEEPGPHGKETTSEEPGPHGDETVSKEHGPHGDETITEEPGPHGNETVSEEPGPHGKETVIEEPGPHGKETVSEEPGPHGDKTVSEESGPHGNETVNEDPGTISEEPDTHGNKTASEETGTHGKDTVREETERMQPDHNETVIEEAQSDHRETVAEEVQADYRRTVAEAAQADHRETVTEGTQSDHRETVAEEAQADHNETQADTQETPTNYTARDAKMEQTVEEETQADHRETVTQETQANHGETVTQETQADHGETVTQETQADHGETVTQETQADHGETVTQETQADHGETVTQETQADHGETVTQETQADHGETVTQETQGDHRVTDAGEALADIIETQADHLETTTEEIQDIFRESAAKGRETVADHAQAEGREIFPEDKRDDHRELLAEGKETVAEGRESVLGDMQDDHRETVTEITVQEIFKPEDKETREGKGELQKEDIDSIINEPFSEEGIIENNRTRETCNEERVTENPSSPSSEAPEITDGNNSDPMKEIADGNVPTRTTETTSIEGDSQLENNRGTEACEKTRLETSEGLSGILLTMVSPGPTLDEGISYKDYETDKGFQEATSGLLLIEALINDPEGQADKMLHYSDIATNQNSLMLSESEYARSREPPGGSFDNLHQDENLSEQVEQDLNEPGLQQIHSTSTEQCTHINDPSSFQKQIGADQEPRQEYLEAEDIVVSPNRPSSSYLCKNPQELDEPDCYSKDLYPSMTFKEGHTAQSSSMEDTITSIGDGELSSEQELLQRLPPELPVGTSSRDSSFSPEHLMVDRDHDAMVYDTVIGFETEESSKTDHFQSPDQWGIASTLQGDPYYEVSPGGRLQSDPFTTSLTATSPQIFTADETVDPKTDSTFSPISNENVKSRSDAEDASSKRQYTFFPTQIFNPILLISGSPEGSGFYQDEALVQTKEEDVYPGHLRQLPQENQVPLRGSQLDHTTGKYDGSLIPTEETSNTSQPMAPPAAPVWLPPRRSRHIGDSGGPRDFKTVRTPENPLVRRATIRHKRNSQAADKRFSMASLPVIPQHEQSREPRSHLQKNPQQAGTNAQMGLQNRQLPRQPRISEGKQESAQPRNVPSMDRLAEEDESAAQEKPSRNPESVILRTKRTQAPPPSPDSSNSIRRRYSTLINSSNLLYQEYSDVALNQEIQRQKPSHSPAEEKDPGSPRLRRRILSSQDSYLQRLSISSADSLWQDLPKVRDSSTFLSMTREEQKLQEAKFELIMSEALYLRSLNIAVDHFQRSPELQEVVSAQDRQWLFSRLSEVRDASSDFLFDLEEEFESNMYNFQVCDVVISHEQNFRRVYLPYVTNQSYQDRTFQRLMCHNPRFQQVLAKLESDPVCQRLSLKSFLILPFQRITRLRLLLQNILKRSAPGSNEELQATEAHNALEKLIRDCNESVQRMKDTEELILLNQKIQFECKIFPLISQSRRLVKHGEVTSLEFNSLSFKWKVTSRPVYLHLFNDCLLLSRVREGGRFVVFDHSSEFRVERLEIKLHSNQKNIFRVFLRESAASAAQDVLEKEYIFRTETQSQKLRWISALSPPKEEIDFLRDHDLPQMQCLKSYKSRENDELSLEKADILMVTQNSDDGWLHGLRLSDLQSGWFPMSHVQPISRNACIRNLQEEKRLRSARAKLHPK